MRARNIVGAGMMVVSAFFGCSSSDDATSAPVDGPAACAATCDEQVAAKCPNMPANYGASCRTLCDSAYGKVPAECKSTRAAYDACTRDKEKYSCNESGTIATTPSGGCAAEAQACNKCSSTAGLTCWGLF